MGKKELVPFMLFVFSMYFIVFYFVASSYTPTGYITFHQPAVQFQNGHFQGTITLGLETGDVIPKNSYVEFYVDNILVKNLSLEDFIALSNNAGKGNLTQGIFMKSGQKLIILNDYNHGYGFAPCTLGGHKYPPAKPEETNLNIISVLKNFLRINIGTAKAILPDDGCQSSWACGEWSECIDGKQSRTCSNLDIKCKGGQKIESRDCYCQPPDSKTITCPDNTNGLVWGCRENTTCKPTCKKIVSDITGYAVSVRYEWYDPCKDEIIGGECQGHSLKCEINNNDQTKTGWYDTTTNTDTLVKQGVCSQEITADNVTACLGHGSCFANSDCTQGQRCINNVCATVSYSCNSFNNKYTFDLSKLNLDLSYLQAGQHELKVKLNYKWKIRWYCVNTVPTECNVQGVSDWKYLWLHKPWGADVFCGQDCKEYPNKCLLKCVGNTELKNEGSCPSDCQPSQRRFTGMATENQNSEIVESEEQLASTSAFFYIPGQQNACEWHKQCKYDNGAYVFNISHYTTQFKYNISGSGKCESALSHLQSSRINITKNNCITSSSRGPFFSVNCYDEQRSLGMLNASSLSPDFTTRVYNKNKLQYCQYGCASDGVSCASKEENGGDHGGSCIPNWSCTSWGPCLVNSIHHRTCNDVNYCQTSQYWRNPKPDETKPCYLKCIEKWQCSEWSQCSDSVQVRDCWDIKKCGTTYEKPSTTQGCTVSEAVSKIRTPVHKNRTWWLPIAIAIGVIIIALSIIFSRKKMKMVGKGKTMNVNVPEHLTNYIKTHLSKGINSRLIKKKLLAAGWPEYVVDNAFKQLHL